ncbi:PorP/SprF family type IX secretion system membrane protein [Winogradskyella aurantiaca]|uniref:PorP/SprF family type IX secretion system membrane protein n=1 Tax=Winogradskyella aurantiaca TaxID=2219558 RepID=UPI000E1CF923|nr:PorP/SprF family type IX secretion system membrane protein [Winogradskyella aurantiaca]
MRTQLLHIIIILFIPGIVWSQGDGVVSYSLPVRNSLTFNRFALSPTFTFVREENKTLSFTNKREWVQFENVPVSYVFGYSGRINERSAAGISLFQRNYGILTTFGGVLNYAYNVPLSYDNNLTFGANLAFYQSGINTGNVISTLPDPSLNNVPSNFLMTFNPSINYGTRFLDVGLTLRNYTLYNFTNSNLVEDDPEQGLQAHLMYTGFLQSGGFFDNSRFSGLVRSEFKNSDVVLSGLVMLTVPKGIWGQLGYHSQNGISVGIGANLLKGIAIEYNYENGITNSINLGSSHEITLAYRFKNKNRYSYSDDMQMSSIIPERKRVKYHKTDEATRARIAARAKARQQQREAALTETTELTTTAISTTDSIEENTINQRQLEIEAAKQKAEELAKEKAEAEALAKLKAKQLKEEEEQRLAQLKATEEQRRQEALAALAAAEAEENRLREEKRKDEARRLAEEQARIRAEEESAQEAARLARLKENEEKRRKEALAILAAAEAEERRQEEERIAELERQRAEQEAQDLAAIAKAEEAKRLERLKAERVERQQKAMAALLAAEAEESKTKSDLAPGMTPDEMKNEVETVSKQISDEQENLLSQLEATVDNRKQDLADLKEENDLSEQGIYKAPKPFKSTSEQNAQLESLTFEIDKTIAAQEQRLVELQKLYDERKKEYSSDDDEMNMIYLDEILIVQKSKRKAEEVKKALMFELDSIKQATEIERKRRIKRAAFDNQEDRYAKDMADLRRIKESTRIDLEANSNDPLDYGETNGGTIKILKDVKHNEDGYYLVMAVHSDKNKRDEFLRAAIKSGEKNISFFYDVNTSKYYIYSKKFSNLKDANEAMAGNNETSLNKNLSMIKIENKSMK